MSLALLDGPRARMAASIRQRIAGSDFDSAHQRIWHSPGPRWFTEDDAIWRVHNDVSMFVGGIRALLLQSLHPVAMAAVSAHSGFRGDPWGRLHRTSHFLATTTYGTIADAERSIAIVNAIHGRVRGRTPERRRVPGRTIRSCWPGSIWPRSTASWAPHQALGGAALERRTTPMPTWRSPAWSSAKLGVHRPARQRRGSPRSTRRLPARAALDGGGARDCRPAVSTIPRSPGLERVGYAVLAAGAVSLLPPWVRVRTPAADVPDHRPAADPHGHPNGAAHHPLGAGRRTGRPTLSLMTTIGAQGFSPCPHQPSRRRPVGIVVVGTPSNPHARSSRASRPSIPRNHRPAPTTRDDRIRG